MPKLLIFDLDDTLFEEKQYVLSGYRAVADYLAQKKGLDSNVIFEFLQEQFVSSGRGGAMDRLLRELSITDIPTSTLVAVYRRHLPDIALQHEVVELLKRLSRSYKLALLTNGWVQVQKRKIKALKLEPVFDLIVYAQERGMRYRKPHGRFFRRVLRHFAVAPHEALMVGDDPIADEEGARQAGIPFCRVQSPGDLSGLIERLEG